MHQREQLKRLIIDYCNQRGNRTFSLQDLHSRYGDYSDLEIGGKTPQATVRRLLQELRDRGFLSFLDNSGCYTLRGIDMLQSEKDEIKTVDLSGEKPEMREYLIETYVRKTQWAKTAKAIFGQYCLFENCNNSFIKKDGSPYIEVHHIVPLCKGGEDGVWNLSVLCAHHHRMAHFAQEAQKRQVEVYLLNQVKSIL